MESTENKEVKKLRTVTVNTSMGERKITMVPFTLDRTRNLVDVICTSSCPYGRVCGKVRHPEHLDDATLTLTDWCVRNSFTDDSLKELSDLNNYYPQEGEIEKLYPENHDSLKQLIGQKQLLDVSEFIDKVCPGFCDRYTPEHTNCSFNNPTCICRELFIRTQDPLVLNESSDLIEGEDKENSEV